MTTPLSTVATSPAGTPLPGRRSYSAVNYHLPLLLPPLLDPTTPQVPLLVLHLAIATTTIATMTTPASASSLLPVRPPPSSSLLLLLLPLLIPSPNPLHPALPPLLPSLLASSTTTICNYHYHGSTPSLLLSRL